MNIDQVRGIVRPNISALSPYSTARDEYQGQVGVFLDANESPYDSGVNRYPDPRQRVLKQLLSQIKGLPVDNIFLGNGSDEAIDLVYRIFCTPGRDNAVVISPSYGMYSVCAQINDIEVRDIPLAAEDFGLEAQKILDACDEHTRLIFLCSPNNPSGNAFPREDLLRIVDSAMAMVVVDEAYADFSSEGSIREEVLRRPNLIVLQTLSKAWGMAGLRLGMAFADEYVIGLMSEVKYPYNISEATQREAIKLLSNSVDEHIREIISERERLSDYLQALPFVQRVYPSEANFILVRVDDADSLYEHLLREGIIVRNRSRVRGCKGCLRVSIGLPEENVKLTNALAVYEKGNICR